MMEIESRQLSKKEIIQYIKDNFKDRHDNDSVCVITNVKSSNGDINQSIVFASKLMKQGN